MRKWGNIVQSTGEKDGKKYWNKVGTFFVDDASNRMTIKLDCLPLPKINQDGYPEIWLNIFQDEPKQQQSNEGAPF
jgi:hypothetical protein